MLSEEARGMLRQMREMREVWPDLSKRDYQAMWEGEKS